MILGAIITHFFVPEVQEKARRGSLWAGKSKSLEELALGKWGPRSQSVIRSQPTRGLGI
jgi:MFS transporter, PHS family, inorganic phosphate transporter